MEYAHDPEGESVSAPSTKKQKPLWQRMYFEPHMTEIVRRIGYDEIPVDDARERLRPLLETYGKERMEEGAAALLDIESWREPPIARLSEDARKLAIQILGRPPEAGTSIHAAPAEHAPVAGTPQDSPPAAAPATVPFVAPNATDPEPVPPAKPTKRRASQGRRKASGDPSTTDG